MLKSFFKSILGGIAISVGGVIYLSLENHIAGAFLFSLGLFTIYTFSLNLFTGKVCYIPNQKPSYLLEVGVVYLGNAVGTVGMGTLLRFTKLSRLVEHTQELVEGKLSDTIFSTLIMAILCGLLMCIAVIGFQTIKDSVGKHLALVLPIMVFILSGFEHSIADLFYFSLAGAWGGTAVLYSAVIAVGNMLGGMLLPWAIRCLDGDRLGLHEKK